MRIWPRSGSLQKMMAAVLVENAGQRAAGSTKSNTGRKTAGIDGEDRFDPATAKDGDGGRVQPQHSDTWDPLPVKRAVRTEGQRELRPHRPL